MSKYIGTPVVSLSTDTVDVTGDITTTDATPEVIIVNDTHEDTDGGREGKVTFKGQQSGGEETTLAEIQASHDGTSDDEKGDLIFKTNDGSDGASPTEAMRIDSDQNIIIGDASKGGSLGQVRIINDASSNPASLALFGHNNVSDGADFAKIQLAMQTGGSGGNVVAQITGEAEGTAENAAHLTFETATGGTLSEAMRITNDAKVGIGTAAPLRQLHIHNTSANSEIAFTAGTSGVSSLLFGDGQTGTDIYRGYLQYNHSDDAMLFATSATERMRINSSGHVLIATTDSTPWTNNANSAADSGIALRAEGFIAAANHSSSPMDLNRTGSDGNIINFYKSGSNIGSISVTSSATAYNTSSDHRLKENVTDVTDGITRVKQLAPKRFNFIVNPDTTVDGFLAHEVQAVVPEAITGTKDEVEVWAEGDELPDGVSVGDSKLDDDGKTIPVMQGIDQSKIVPLLTAALQEAIAKIETLETKVAALEGE